MLAMRNLHDHAFVVAVFAHVHLIALLAQFVRHVFERGAHHVSDEALHMGAARHHDHVAQAPLPGLPATRGTRQRQRLVADATLGRVQLQRLEEAPQGQQKDDGEWQRAGDGGGLQGGQAVGQQQRDRHRAHQHRPEDALPHGRAIRAAGRQQVDHQRARVGRGDEEHRHHRDGDDGQHPAPGQLLKKGEQRQGRIGLHHFGQALHLVDQDHVNGGIAEHRHPEQGEAGRHQQHPGDEFANGAAARDARDEQADEGRPRDPPAPVKQGPATDPVGRFVGVQVEGLVDDVRQVGAGVLHEGLEQEHRGADHQHEQQQHRGQHQIGLRQDADALVQAAGHRQGRQAASHDDQDNLRGHAHRRAEQVVQTAVDLRHAQAQGSGHTQNRANNGEDVHRMSDGTVDAVADQGIQRRAQGQRQAVPVTEKGQDQRHHCVDGPGVQPPMEERDLHRFAGRDGRASFAHGRRYEVHHGLGHAEEHQADTHACREQHREPGEVAVVGFAVVRPELDVAVAADRQEHHRDQNDGYDQDVEPTGVAQYPALHGFKQALRRLGRQDGESDQQQREHGRGKEHGAIDGG